MQIYPSGSRWVCEGADSDAANHLPGAKVYANGNIVGPSDAIAVLAKRFGLATIPPQVEVGEFVGPEYLRQYQLEGIAWLVEHLGHEGGALLADDMGLGKTMQAIHTWESLERPQVLVVSPASVRLGWVHEFEKWVGQEATLVDSGKKMEALDPFAPVIITSYELGGRLPESCSPSMLIIDEVQNLRGRGAKRARALLPIAQAAAFRLGLSGTPMWSRVRDLWMVLHILFPSYRFGRAEDFDFAYCGAFYNQWGGRVAKGATRSDELALRLSYVQLRRTKEQVADELPTLSRTVRYVEGTREAKLAARAWAAGRLSLYDALNATLEAKISAVVEAAVDAGQPTLIFTWQKAHAKEIVRQLLKEGITVELLTGDLSMQQRNTIVRRAAGDRATLVATIDSTGTGVDGLQHVASIGIFHALDWVPIKLAQAEARLHRIGQKDSVQWIYTVMRDSADQLVESTVIEKLDAWRQVMGVDAAADLASSLGGATMTPEQQTEVLADIMAAFKEEFE